MELRTIYSLDDQLVRITELSPSGYSAMRAGCLYPFVISKTIKDLKLNGWLIPNLNKAAYFGTIAHKLLEERVYGRIQDQRQYIQMWKQLADEKIAEIKGSFPSITDFRLTDYSVVLKNCNAALKVKPYSAEDCQGSSTNKRTLERFVKVDGLISGFIDRLIFKSDGLEIIDYKTGEIFEESGAIKESIRLQMQLYAIACESELNRSVISLKVLHTPTSTIVDIPIERDRFLEIKSEIRNLIAFCNNAIETQNISSLQKPNEHCGFCNCCHLCDSFIQSSPDNKYFVYGKVIDNSNPNMLMVKNPIGEQIVVNNLSDMNIGNWDDLLGKTLAFINVRSFVDGIYQRLSNTIIYIIKDSNE